jgi:3-dehydroquinate synthetase
MDIANYISQEIGMMDMKVYRKISEILNINFPKYDWKNFNFVLFFDSLSKDKKNEGEKLGCILSQGPGMLQKEFLDIDEKFKALIYKYFHNIDHNNAKN